MVRSRIGSGTARPSRGHFGLIRALAAALILSSCAPATQEALHPPATYQGPRFEGDKFYSFDGAALGLTTWNATTTPGEVIESAADGGPEQVAAARNPPPQPVEPWAVIIGVHGMNDYANTFYLAGPYWAEHGVTTYAYDARGFGRSPRRGVWPGEDLMVDDLRTAVAVARKAHPKAIIAIVGESMGAAEAVVALAGNDPPAADRVILAAPAVWGWDALPRAYAVALWMGAHGLPHKTVTPPRGVAPIPSDNNDMLRKLGRDKLMLFNTRIDAVYGLVTLMNDAAKDVGDVKVPIAYLYGQKDQIIPKKAAMVAANRLPASARTAYYPQGYHMILRDLHAQAVWDDTLAFIKDPNTPFPSQAPALILNRKR